MPTENRKKPKNQKEKKKKRTAERNKKRKQSRVRKVSKGKKKQQKKQMKVTATKSRLNADTLSATMAGIELPRCHFCFFFKENEENRKKVACTNRKLGKTQ